MFERLTERLEAALRRLRGRGRLSAEDVDGALREVRLALLEADVHFAVVKDLLERVRRRAVGAEVQESLAPGHQVVKIVYEELAALMGGRAAPLARAPQPPTVVVLVGLQGSGKTTTAGKLAHLLQRQGRRALLVAADTRRPAAAEQLRVLAERLQLPCHLPAPGQDPVEVAREGVRQAVPRGCDTAIVDTAGRLHVDEELLAELAALRRAVEPHEVLLVVDAMTGQEAVRLARRFDEAVGIDGVVLTKLDGDARGGAALSIRAATGKPVKLAGTGERLDALEPFHPERMASRILGLGDVLTLIERAEAGLDAERARRLEERAARQELTLEDMLEQLEQVSRLGPLDQLLRLVPGLARAAGARAPVDEQALRRARAIIQSMTPYERRHPEVLNASRKRRIAAGSGTAVQDVNRLLRQFEETRRLLRALAGSGRGGPRAARRLLQGLGPGWPPP